MLNEVIVNEAGIRQCIRQDVSTVQAITRVCVYTALISPTAKSCKTPPSTTCSIWGAPFVLVLFGGTDKQGGMSMLRTEKGQVAIAVAPTHHLAVTTSTDEKASSDLEPSFAPATHHNEPNRQWDSVNSQPFAYASPVVASTRGAALLLTPTLLAERLNGQTLHLKDGGFARLKASVSARKPETVSMNVTSPDGDQLAFGSRNVVDGQLDKGSFMTFKDAENKGIARAVYDAYAQAVPTGTTLRIESAQKETNVVLTRVLGEVMGRSDTEMSAELLAAGRQTKWARIIEKSGLWKLAHVQPMDSEYEDDGHHLTAFELHFTRA